MTARHSLLLLTLLTVSLGLTGCAQLQAKLQQLSLGGPKEKTEAPPPSPPSPAITTHKSIKALNLHQIIGMLEDGKYADAAIELKYYLIKNPKDPTASNLLKQLTYDPLTMLGSPARKYTVQPGDTLGGIAAKFLGNPLDFVILARYNRIKRSKDLQAGQVLDLPATQHADEVLNKQQGNPKQSDKDTDTTTLAPDRGQLPVEKLEALPSPEPATPAGEKPRKKTITPIDEDLALKQQAIGMNALDKGQDVAAYQAFQHALTLDPSLQPARHQAEILAKKLVERFHKQALTAYREQKLDKAIGLWNRALDIDPNYEPALGYRARALELKQRLKQLERKK